MNRCVVYLRVSTPSQSLGSSLARQLECCTRYARENGLYVAAVFSDSSSGDGPMPSRSLAFVTATTLKCPIVAESLDRWSRRSVGGDELSHAQVLFASPDHEERQARLAMNVSQMIAMQALHARIDMEAIK
jgi:DNA invertase Pin-like site-specific DNA recombinase